MIGNIFSGRGGYVHAVVSVFGENATLLRRGDGTPEDDGYEEYPCVFAWTSRRDAEGASRLTGGVVTSREPTMLRRREERLEGVLSSQGIEVAPRAAEDRLVVAGKEYRIDAVESLRVAGRDVGWRLLCVRS